MLLVHFPGLPDESTLVHAATGGRLPAAALALRPLNRELRPTSLAASLSASVLRPTSLPLVSLCSLRQSIHNPLVACLTRRLISVRHSREKGRRARCKFFSLTVTDCLLTVCVFLTEAESNPHLLSHSFYRITVQAADA